MKLITTTAVLIMSLIVMSFHIIEGYEVGDTATDFSLKNVDDTFVSLSDYTDVEGYIVIFTCNTCPYAVLYEDRIQALHDQFADQGFPVIAINPNNPDDKQGDSFDKMKERAADKNFEFPYLFDDGQEVYPQFGATKTPHTYVLDKDRVVRYIGAIDDNPQDASGVSIEYVASAVAAIKEGKDPHPATTKAIGCRIKS